MSKGFVTVAFGEQYCKLAAHLYMSYRLFANCDLPFYVFTDADGKEKLKNLFDGVIVQDNPTKSFFDKMLFFTEPPFDENIFIDADCSVVRDLSNLFHLFEKNGSAVSAISDVCSLEGKEAGSQFGKAAIEHWGLTYDFPGFNGGIYYYRKSPEGEACVRFMMEEVIPKYDEYHLLGYDEHSIADEPIVIVAMIRFGMKTVSFSLAIMYLIQTNKDANGVKWNFRKRTCEYIWFDQKVSPAVIHWKFGGTETYNYERLDAKLRGLYYGWSFFKVKKLQFLSFIKFYVYKKLLKGFPGIRKFAKKFSS